MGIGIKVVIPSAGRFHTCITHKYIDGCTYCVPERELEFYKERLGKKIKIVAHPDTVIGMGAKRNWIVQEFGNVFMVDDDLKGLSRLYRKDTSICTPAQAYNIIQHAGNIAHLTGCYLFGFNKSARILNYNGLRPIGMKGYVNGAAIGILKGGMLKFSENIICNNDVYISLLNAFQHKKAYIDNRFVIRQDGIAKNIGGMARYRTDKAQESDKKELKKCFGKAIEFRQVGKTGNRVNIHLKLPF